MYNHEPNNYLYPCCSIIKGNNYPGIVSLQSDVIFKEEKVTAFISLHQSLNNHGSIVIVPNEHYENIYDLPEEYGIYIQRAVKKVVIAMKAIYSCDGVSTRQHNEPGGNQDVWHYHLHVAPRYLNDNFYFSKREVMMDNERAEHARRYKEYFSTISS